jgi:hypothetical protein
LVNAASAGQMVNSGHAHSSVQSPSSPFGRLGLRRPLGSLFKAVRRKLPIRDGNMRLIFTGVGAAMTKQWTRRDPRQGWGSYRPHATNAASAARGSALISDWPLLGLFKSSSATLGIRDGQREAHFAGRGPIAATLSLLPYWQRQCLAPPAGSAGPQWAADGLR